MKSTAEASYNERLFSGGLRTFLHEARFHWLTKAITSLGCKADRVLELGCYDGRAIDFLPYKPSIYKGYDANYERALELAAAKWKNHPNFQFLFATTPEHMLLKDDERFDIAISMETLEHVPPSLVSPYLQKIALHLHGYIFITVPNEKGLAFFAKWLGKRIFTSDSNPYSLRDVFNHVTGRLNSVERNEHKGFDYALLLNEVAKHFDIVDTCSLPFAPVPSYLSFGIAIVGKSKAL